MVILGIPGIRCPGCNQLCLLMKESIERGVRVKVEAGIGLGEEAPHLFHDIMGDLRRGGGAAWIAVLAFHCCWWGRFRDDLVVLRLGKVFPKAVIFRKWGK